MRRLPLFGRLPNYLEVMYAVACLAENEQLPPVTNMGLTADTSTARRKLPVEPPFR